MSFPERVSKRVNQLIEKFGGNPTRLSDYSSYQRWAKDSNLDRDWNTQVRGETYGERVFLKTSKSAMGKNSVKIQQFNRFLKQKRGRNVTMDDLAGFITAFICLHVKAPIVRPAPPKPVVHKPVVHTVAVVEEEDDHFDTSAATDTSKPLLDMPVVDSWEDL